MHQLTHTRRRLASSALGLMTVLVAALPLGCAQDDEAAGTPEGVAEAASTPNQLTAAEQDEGWTLLFDGSSFAGWRGLGQDSIPTAHWVVEDGMIRKIASGNVPVQADGQPVNGGDIMTEDTYDDFELAFEWKVTPGANSGVKYNVSEEMSAANPPGRAALGFEYQVLDDDQHPDAKNGGNRTAGALYDLIEPGPNKHLKPVGEFNASRIVFRGNHGEHWLNGEKIVEYDLGSPRFDSLFAASKYKDIEGFADKRAGHIVLQDHNDEVWFRNLKIRELPAQ